MTEITELLKSDMPGGSIADHHLLTQKLVEPGTASGFRSPDGYYFPTTQDEELVLVLNETGGRDPFIQNNATGELIAYNEWGPKMAHDNREHLKDSGEVGVFFARLYDVAIEENPVLQSIIIHTSGKDEILTLAETGGFATHKGKTDSGLHEITVNTDDGKAHYKDLLTKRRVSAEMSAQKVGMAPGTMEPKHLAAFIFLHELGHIVDFNENAPDYEVYKERRNDDMMTLPAPGYNPALLAQFMMTPDGAEYLTLYSEYFKQKGIMDVQGLLEAQEVAYHSLETEDIPDQFAARVMQRMFAQGTL